MKDLKRKKISNSQIAALTRLLPDATASLYHSTVIGLMIEFHYTQFIFKSQVGSMWSIVSSKNFIASPRYLK